jgi:hypothetical protein
MKSKRIWLLAFCAAFLALGMACLLTGKTQPQPSAPQNNPVPQPLPQNNNPPDNNPSDNNPPDVNPPQPAPLENQNPPAQFKLTGIWESQTQTAYGMVYSELILEPTKTFSQQVTLGNLLTYDVGRYEVGDGFIHFVVEDHEPKEYLGKKMSWLTSFTYFYTPIDENSMLLEDHVAGTQWTMIRR